MKEKREIENETCTPTRRGVHSSPARDGSASDMGDLPTEISCCFQQLDLPPKGDLQFAEVRRWGRIGSGKSILQQSHFPGSLISTGVFS